MKQIMLHACCAVCAGYPLELLKEKGYEPVVYFFNPNIHPEEEYTRRLNELIRHCEKYGYKLIIGENSTDEWFEYVKGLENEPERGERCKKCFEYRLNKTAEKAKELDIDTFTTTLFISPHKVRKDILEKGIQAAEKYALIFDDTDFRKQNGFLKTMEIAKAENFYRQKYCGCIYAQKMP
ncbi:MAG: epoxyqueuosine reductase QueH [Candidatus Gastranaerophilales bacterium]|nr:epoxyqueuosine reductase QueH [Candidatus Gastranaerophilales bacterium]